MSMCSAQAPYCELYRFLMEGVQNALVFFSHFRAKEDQLTQFETEEIRTNFLFQKYFFNLPSKGQFKNVILSFN